jgi:hypothetical protein
MELDCRKSGRTVRDLRGGGHQLRIRLIGVGQRRDQPWHGVRGAPLGEGAIGRPILHGGNPIGDMVISRDLLAPTRILVEHDPVVVHRSGDA